MDIYQTLIDNALGNGGGGGGGGSSYELLARAEYTVSTTSTSSLNVGTVPFAPYDVDLGNDKIYYVRICDKAGNRKGHFCESHKWFFRNPNSNNTMAGVIIRNDSGTLSFSTIGTYGVYADSMTKIGDNWGMQIKSKYSSSSSLIIDGTYVVEIYRLDYSNNESPASRCIE